MKNPSIKKNTIPIQSPHIGEELNEYTIIKQNKKYTESEKEFANNSKTKQFLFKQNSKKYIFHVNKFYILFYILTLNKNIRYIFY